MGPGFGAHPVGLQKPGCLYTVSLKNAIIRKNEALGEQMTAFICKLYTHTQSIRLGALQSHVTFVLPPLQIKINVT